MRWQINRNREQLGHERLNLVLLVNGWGGVSGLGDFRNWARLTALTRTALKRTGPTRVDQEVLRWTLSRLGAGEYHCPPTGE